MLGSGLGLGLGLGLIREDKHSSTISEGGNIHGREHYPLSGYLPEGNIRVGGMPAVTPVQL